MGRHRDRSGGRASSVTIDVLANDTDVDAGDTKSIVSVDGSETPGWIELIIIYGVGVGIWHPGTPAIQGAVSIAPDGQSVMYSPGNAFQSLAIGESATETFRYTRTDSAGAHSTAAVTVTVTGVASPAPAPAAAVATVQSAETNRVNTPAAESLTISRRVDRPDAIAPLAPATIRQAATIPGSREQRTSRHGDRRFKASLIDAVFDASVASKAG